MLIVQEPWLSYVLSGQKIWEIRRQDTKVRGLIGLGLNKKMLGTAILNDSFPMSVKDLVRRQDKTMLPTLRLKDYACGKKALFVWVLKNAEKLKTPVTIPRSYGTWVLQEDKS